MCAQKPSYIVYKRASLKLDTPEKTVEFLYPANLGWNCTRCGTCCRDAGKRERLILLLESDISKLKGRHDSEEFVESIGGREPFVAKMKKIGGRCFFLSDDGCSVYDRRALLCRIYPFWVERSGDLLIIRIDNACPGTSGKPLSEVFYSDLLGRAVAERGGI